jgi:hypothetical protein
MTRTQVISAAVTVALITGAVLLGGAPRWVGAAVAALGAAAIGLAYARDRRRGDRWF